MEFPSAYIAQNEGNTQTSLETTSTVLGREAWKYYSTNGTNSLRVFMGNESEVNMDDAKAYTQVVYYNATTGEQLGESQMGYTSIDKIGENYYVIFYPYCF